MKRIIAFIIFFTAFQSFNAFAGDSDIEGCRIVDTVAGKLTISDADKMRTDGLYSIVELNGNAFDKLYGFAGSCDKHTLKSGLVDRMLMYDFDNGGNNPPSISLYDFRDKPAVAIPIGGPLLVDEIRWVPDAVLLKLRGGKYRGWYKFNGEKLIAIRAPK
jgi:hypothetical protein